MSHPIHLEAVSWAIEMHQQWLPILREAYGGNCPTSGATALSEAHMHPELGPTDTNFQMTIKQKIRVQ